MNNAENMEESVIKTSVMKYELKYREKVVRRVFYDTSVKNKEAKFYIKLKKILEEVIIPMYKDTIQSTHIHSRKPLANRFSNMYEMTMHDQTGENRFDPKALTQEGVARTVKQVMTKDEITQMSVATQDIIEMTDVIVTGAIADSDKKSCESKIIERFDQWLLEFFPQTPEGKKMVMEFEDYIQKYSGPQK